MGLFVLTLHGGGQHHSSDPHARERDADELCRRFLDALRQVGIQPTSAIFSHAGGHEILHTPSIQAPTSRGRG